MTRTLHHIYLVLIVVLLFHARAVHSIDISIVHPQKNDTLSIRSSDSTFIYGHILPANALLEINGNHIPLYSGGAFLAYLPVHRGEFAFHCRAVSMQDTIEIVHPVFISPVYKQIKDSLDILKTSIHPDEDWFVQRGDLIQVWFQGTPQCQAAFSINGIAEHIPMTETVNTVDPDLGEMVFGQGNARESAKRSGFYTGSFLLQEDLPAGSGITCYLYNSNGDTVQCTAPGRLFPWDNTVPKVAVTKNDRTTLRTGPGKSYYYFLPKGVKLELGGKRGNFYRVRLAQNTTAWVEPENIELLPKGTLSPRTTVRLVRTFDFPKKSRIIIFTNSRQPFRIEQSASPSTLLVTLYGVTADTDWIRYDPNDRLVKTIRWEQSTDEVYTVSIDLDQKQQWGYNAFYDDHDNLVIDVKKSPAIAGWPRSPLYKIHVMLDPGHAPDTGAVCPYGHTEAQANLLLANALKEKLRQKGAIVTFTRSDSTGRSLYSRQRLAINLSPHILLSLHHNGLPDGVNPFKNRGSSTFYYHPQSYELAKSIQEQLIAKLHLNNYGVFWDNLAMCRPAQFPAVLIEPAFMIHPEEARLIQSESYRKKCAVAIVKGLETFLLHGN